MKRATHPEPLRRVASMAAEGVASGGGSPVGTRTLRAESRRSEVQFFLQRVEGGLYVEREEVPRSGSRTVQSIQFADPGQFGRWCDDDPVRFEHPRLFIDLRRAADELWRAGTPY